MRRLRWSVAARDDLFAALDRAEANDPAAAEQLLAAVLEAPNPLLDHPYMGPELGYVGTRKWPVRGTTLVLLYSVTNDALRIDRIVDARSDWRTFL